MRQIFITFIALLVLASAGGLYALKHRVQDKREAVARLEQQILDDTDALRVLQAEWAYLTSPSVIQDRMVRYLRLRPVAPDQVVDNLAVLPYRLDEFVVSALRGDDVRPVPQPRNKPPAPRLPIDGGSGGDVLLSSADKTINSKGGHQRAAVRRHVTDQPDSALSFGARMEKALERIGGR